jgi:heat shock protein HtpX
MLPAAGLYGHIRNNNIKSVLLLVGFVVQVGVLWLAVTLAPAGLGSYLMKIRMTIDLNHEPTQNEIYAALFQQWMILAYYYAYVPVIAIVVWFAYAYMSHRELIRAATGAQPISRLTESKLYNLVENLAIASGLPMPRVEIIETNALNAYAAGLGPERATVAVTRGLLNTLSDAELEAVLAHEITHIRNRDVRLMMVATIFAGALTYGGEMMRRQISFKSPLARTAAIGDFMLLIVAVCMASMAGVFAMLSRLALSRSREYLADAGAVELTKDPDALISALQRIEGHDEIEGLPTSMRAMMISSHIEGLLSTHPSTESRIAALQTFAGGTSSLTPRAERPARGVSAVGIARATAEAPSPAGPRPFGRRVRPPENVSVR